MTIAPDPTAIIRLSTAYWDSQTLLTANRIRLFDALADGPRSPAEVAAALQLDARATALLLRACAGSAGWPVRSDCSRPPQVL